MQFDSVQSDPVVHVEPSARSASVRTCVGCRATDDGQALVRFVVGGTPPRLAVDARRTLGGRGASVHPRRSCLRVAARRGFQRAFRTNLSVDQDDVVSLVREYYDRRIQGLLLAGRRAKQLRVGTEAVRRWLLGSPPHPVVLFAEDAAGRRADLERQLQLHGGTGLVWSNKIELGRLLGREAVGVVAIADPRLGSAVGIATSHLADLSEVP